MTSIYLRMKQANSHLQKPISGTSKFMVCGIFQETGDLNVDTAQPAAGILRPKRTCPDLRVSLTCALQLTSSSADRNYVITYIV